MSRLIYRTKVPPAVLSSIVFSMIPVTAYAQNIPIVYALAALSPLLAIILAILLGWISHSFHAGVMHVVLLLAWVILFSLAAYFIENDYVIWTPLVIYAAHCSLIIILIAVHTARRIRGMWKDKTSKTGNSPPTE